MEGLRWGLVAQWEAKEGVDVAVESVEGERVWAHKVVLAAASTYLRAVFWRGREEGGGDILKVVRTGTEARVLKEAIHWAYEGRLAEAEPVEEMVESLVGLADYWGMASLLGELGRRMLVWAEEEKELLLPLHRLASFYPSLGVGAQLRQRLLYHLAGLGPQLEELEATELEGLLADDWLKVWTEEEVWAIAKAWARSGKEGLASLAAKVRLSLLTDKAVLAEIRAVLGPATMIGPSLRRCPQDVVMALGGWSAGAPTGLMESLAVGDGLEEGGWREIGETERPLAYHGVGVIGEEVVVVGGFDGSEYYNSVRRWRVREGVWEAGACMTVARCYVSVAVVGSEVWAVGGFDGRSRLSSCERYDGARNQWSLLPPMRSARSDAAAVYHLGRLYVLGGFDGQSVLASTEWLDPLDLESGWHPGPSLLSPRSGLSAVSTPDGIVVAGGFDGEQRLASASLLPDAEPSGFQPLPAMAQARSNFSLLCLPSHSQPALLAVGGYSGLQTISDVEMFHLANPQWRPAPNMSLNRSALKAFLLPNTLPTHVLSNFI